MNSRTIQDIDEYGAYCFWCIGHCFYLEIRPVIFNVKGRKYLQQEAESALLPAKGNEKIFEFTDIMEVDFFMQRFGSK